MNVDLKRTDLFFVEFTETSNIKDLKPNISCRCHLIRSVALGRYVKIIICYYDKLIIWVYYFLAWHTMMLFVVNL